MSFHIHGSVGEGAPSLGKMTQGLGYPLRDVIDSAGVTTLGVTATFNAGNGTVHDDVNNTDFTSQVGTTFITVTKNMVLTVVHNTVAYNYVGPRDVTIGVGGSYQTAAEDYAGIGTADHAQLVNRDVSGAHEIDNITGLVEDQQRQDDALSSHVNSDLSTGGDPHPGYTKDEEALATFVLAGYGGVHQNARVSMGNINLGYYTVPMDDVSVVTPRFINQDVAGNGLRFERMGIYVMYIYIAIEHDSSNSGRTMRVRLYNSTDGAASPGTVVGIGRNQTVTNLGVSLLLEVTSDYVNDLWQMQIGGASSDLNDVFVESAALESSQVGEAAALESGTTGGPNPPGPISGGPIQNVEIGDFDNDGDNDLRVTID